MGWLHSVPRGGSARGSTAERPTRLESITKGGGVVHLPPVVLGLPTLQKFMDVGPCSPGAGGPAALSYTELQAYSTVAGANLAPWEAKLLRDLSKVYVSFLRQGETPATPPPYVDNLQVQRDVVNKRLSTAFKALAARGKKK